MKKYHNKNIEKLEEELKYKFKDPSILENALTHGSFINEAKDPSLKDNERLEFLGDSVLNQSIAHILFQNYPEKPEGWLSKTKSILVSKDVIAQKALDMNLDKLLLLGKGEAKSGGRKRASVLADTFEAVMGALFLDGGYEICKKFITKNFKKDIEKILAEELLDFKTKLQELTQELYRSLPRYEIIEEKGPLHKISFHVKVILKGKELGRGHGSTKKEAGQMAAKKAIDNLRAISSQQSVISNNVEGGAGALKAES